MAEQKKKRKSIVDTLTYVYIRKIKKWMFCPACQNGKMTINKKSTLWICEECGYKLSADEFEDDYVFWFCDECKTFLNKQEGFNRGAVKHICTECGSTNIQGISRVTGYLSLDERFGAGKEAERRDRLDHNHQHRNVYK